MANAGFFDFKCIYGPRTTTSCSPVNARRGTPPDFRRFEWEPRITCGASLGRRGDPSPPFLENEWIVRFAAGAGLGDGRGLDRDVAIPRDHAGPSAKVPPFCIWSGSSDGLVPVDAVGIGAALQGAARQQAIEVRDAFAGRHAEIAAGDPAAEQRREHIHRALGLGA